MEIKLQKWGNSLGIRLPSNILKEMNLKINDLIKLEKVEDKIIISKSNNRKISLRDRFKNYEGENLAKEFSWDSPRGKEIW